ncbi:lantibiotic dehydratase [Streptomyces celluloflavus]|uniref:lantibiotic dehydratase n=1 Tax=Streptomyces celluloflavus TaxID=58344 RepID=UPI0036D9F7C9
MTRRSPFTAVGPVLLRSAALPHDTFDEAVEGFGRTTAPTDAELVAYLTGIAAHPLLREAIAVSSDALSAELDKIAGGAAVSRKKLIRAAISVTRYARRITGRPTPFGLFAGVSVPGGEDRPADAPTAGAAVKSARPDAGWFDGLAAKWLADPDVRASLHVVLNNLCFVRGDRLVLPHVRLRSAGDEKATTTRQASEELSLRCTPVLSWVREAAARPVPYRELLAAAVAAHPRLGEARLEAFLGSLVAHEVLLTQLAPTRLDDPYLESLERVLPADSEERAHLAAVRAALAAYGGTAPGEGREPWRRLVEVSGRAHRSRAVAPQVDLRLDTDAEIPPVVTEEIERYAAAMWSMSPKNESYAHMRGYRRAFLDAYGQHGAVRLAELVDPHRGLGYPDTYLHPRTSNEFPSGKRAAAGADDRIQALADVLHRGLADERREVVLTEEDVRRLTVDPDAPVPASLELCFQLLAGSAQDLAAGRFDLLTTPSVGTPTAGAMAGRFAALTDSAKDLGRLMADTDGALAAQVTFRPVLPRALNVMQVPGLLPHSIPVGTFGDPGGEGCIDWRDLVVAADGDRLRLYRETTGQEIRPVIPHVLSLGTAAPNLARLLGELPYCGEDKTWQPWDWGPFEHLPWLPRVRLGRVVLSPLSWRPSAAMRESAGRGKDWGRVVDAWRTGARVPDRVTVGQRDQLCELDLGNAFHQEILRREIARGRVTVTESPRDSGDVYGWLGGRSNEIIVPLRGAPRPPGAEPSAAELDVQRLANSAAATAHHPGGEWAFVELHGVPEVHEELLTRHLPPLIDRTAGRVDRWFFMRYREAGHHIRLRLHGDPAELVSTVWPELLGFCDSLQKAGLIRDFQVSSYAPEVSRYGGPEGVRRAEEWFCADSGLATGLLTLLAGGGGAVRKDLLLLAGYVHLLESLGPWDWCSWVDRSLPRENGAAPARSDIAAAALLVPPGRAREELARVLPAPALPALDRVATTARGLGELLLPGIGRYTGRGWQDTAVASLLHMHHNRLYGIDPYSEARSLALLAHAARAHLGRARHTAPPGAAPAATAEERSGQ